MTLGYGWAILTILSLVTGFVAAWRKLEVPRVNPLPVMTQWGPVAPAVEPERRSFWPSLAVFVKMWLVWLVSFQVIYAISKAVFLLADNRTEVGAPIVAAAGWLGTSLLVVAVLAVSAGVGWWVWWRRHPVDEAEEQPLPHVSAPSVQPAISQQPMWTAPTYQGNWDEAQN